MTSPGCLAGYVKNKFLVSSSKKVILGKIRMTLKPVTSWNDQCPDVMISAQMSPGPIINQGPGRCPKGGQGENIWVTKGPSQRKTVGGLTV